MPDSANFQEDINKLHAWSTKWQLLFHPDKCKVVHIGRTKSPPVDAYNSWNLINPEIRNAVTGNIFKSKLKASLIKYFENDWRYDLQYTIR